MIILGGTAACVAAGRLALADPSLSILLIEGGRNNLNDPSVTTPAVYLSHLAPNSQTAIFYKSQASKELLGREAIVPMGGILGGGSSINFMMYTRAQAVDYDSWNTEGWDFESVLPSFKRVKDLFSPLRHADSIGRRASEVITACCCRGWLDALNEHNFKR